MAIENPIKNLFIALLICSTTFWLYMANTQEAGTDGVLPYMAEGPNICKKEPFAGIYVCTMV
jgi:hypothetical protein